MAALADYTSAEALALRENNTEVLDALKEPLARLRALVPKLTLRLAKGATETARDVVVSIDGAPLATGLVGTPIPVEAGRHRVEAQAKNRVPFVLEVVLRDRESAAFDIVLENAASSLETRAESGAHARAATSLRPWGIAAAGGAVALGAFGVVSYVVAGNAVDSGRVVHDRLESLFLGASVRASVGRHCLGGVGRRDGSARDVDRPLHPSFAGDARLAGMGAVFARAHRPRSCRRRRRVLT